MTAEHLKLDPEGPCLFCGGHLDTGWECNDCGADNRDWYYPKHERAPEKPILGLCKAGNMVPVNGECPYCGAAPGEKCGRI